MPSPSPLESGASYHIYNRGTNRENVFVEERNYEYFLKLYAEHVMPHADTFSYCLMRNHFHLFIRVHEEAPAGVASHGFAKLFGAYSQAINKANGRTGSLFEHPFRRRIVSSESYALRLASYIHFNPQKHGFTSDFRMWPHSSYRTLIRQGATRLNRDELLAWFGGRNAFILAHEQFVEDDWVNQQDFDD
jgi:REP element-mobilizing transposase RayT